MLLKKALLGAIALGAMLAGSMARAEDLKEFRIGIIGGENEADRLRNYQCLADQLQKDFGFEKVRFSRRPTMTALSRVCSAAHSISPNLALPAMPKSTSRTRRRSTPILTTQQTDGSTGLLFDRLPARTPASSPSRTSRARSSVMPIRIPPPAISFR